MKRQNVNSTGAALFPDRDDQNDLKQTNRQNTIVKKDRHFMLRGSAGRLLILSIVCIFVGEVLVELFVSILPPLSQLGTALLDSVLLIVPVFPILYFFVFRPLQIHITERKQAVEALKNSLSLTEAVLESIHGGILVVSNQGTVIKTNAKFAKMWRIPDDILASGNDKILLYSVHEQLTDPDGFIATVSDLYGKPEAESLDSIDLKDGRIFKRISKPLYFESEPIGRVWSFLDITGSKKTEEALENEQYLMVALMNNIPDHIYFKDCENRFVRINNAQAQLFGLSDPAQAIGKTDFDFFTEEHAQQAFEDEQKIIRTGQPISMEEKETWTDRPDTWVSTTKMPLYDKNEKIIGTFGISTDITERKQAEVALLNSEARLRTLVQTIPDLIWLKDIDGVYLSCNTMFERFFGNKEADIVGKTDYDFVDHELADFFREHDRKAMTAGKPTSNEEFITFADDGHCAFLETIKTPMCDASGKLLGVLGIGRDITKRKQAEVALQESEALYRNLVLKLPDGVYKSTHDGKFVDVNPAMVTMLEYESKEELMAIDIKTQLYFEQADRESVELQENQEELGIYRMRKKDDSEIWVEDNGWYNLDENGNILFHEGIIRDITERKRAEEEIKLKNEELIKIVAEKDKFFSIIAHDLRSPFNGFLGLTQIMAEELPGLTMAEIQDIALNLRNSANNLFRLLENLLEWARMQQGLIPFDPKVLKLTPVINESIAMVLDLAENKRIEITCNIPYDLTVFADVNILQTIIRNLVTNAVKFTPKGGKICISANATGNKGIEISIRDTGIGMNPKMVEQLFRLDVQTNRKGTEGEPSTGLGLLICKEFVEKHGGKIWVESEVGKGSVFYFTI